MLAAGTRVDRLERDASRSACRVLVGGAMVSARGADCLESEAYEFPHPGIAAACLTHSLNCSSSKLVSVMSIHLAS
jgi:hypothetical protein